MNGHRFDIIHHALTKPISAHFHNHFHALRDIKVQILDYTNNTAQRKRGELNRMCQLMSNYPFGLNVENVLYKKKTGSLLTDI